MFNSTMDSNTLYYDTSQMNQMINNMQMMNQHIKNQQIAENSNQLVPYNACDGDSDLENENIETTIDSNELYMFKEKVKEWIEIDNQIRKLKTYIKEKKKQLDELNQDILDFMGKHKIEDLNTNTGKLKYYVSTTKTPINKKTLESRLCDYFQNSEQGKNVTSFIYDKRDIKTSVKLKRTFKKKKNFSIV